MSNPKIKETLVTVYVDGACSGNPGDTGLGIVIENKATGFKENISQYAGLGTNNYAEYKALIVALERIIELGIGRVQIKSDSELLVKQLKGIYKVKKEHLKILYDQARMLAGRFDVFEIEHVRRELNAEADLLAKKAITEYRRTNRMVAAQQTAV
jgi:ribonuclease HI